LRFLIDEQLPPALAELLRGLGHSAEHVRDIGLGGATDAEIRRQAARRKAVLITKDVDFSVLAGPLEIQVVWVRLGNTTNTALRRALEPRLPEIESALMAGETLIEIA
jgi:predicted nuclease of predicted toxin-antitoxin system